LLLLASGALMIASMRTDSATTDENVHLFAGYTYVARGDFRLNPEHPPLLKAFSALPLLLMPDLQVRFDNRWDEAGAFYVDGWQVARSLGSEFLYSWGNDAQTLLFAGRLMTITLTLVLGVLAFHWAQVLYGAPAGLVAAFLVLFLPTTLAHGRLVTTDLGVTLFLFASVYTFGQYWKQPTGLRLVRAGACAGLALASKYTSLMLLPILLALIGCKLLSDRSLAKGKSYLGQTALALGVAAVVVWAAYGFSLKTPPPTDDVFAEAMVKAYHQPSAWFAASYPTIRLFLIPADFYKGLLNFLGHVLSGHRSFLLGMSSDTGWWYYFPFAILVKTPLPWFILFFVAWLARRRRPAADRFDEYLLLVPPALYLALSMRSRTNLGVRHMLPMFPFIAVFVSQAVHLVDWGALSRVRADVRKAVPALFAVGLIAWYAATALSAFPNYIAYFNEPAGGARNGHRLLSDSNLDWGQNLLRIKEHLGRAQLGPVYMVYPWHPSEAWAHYGIQAQPLPPRDSSIRGTVVASAYSIELDDYAWLRSHPSVMIAPGVFRFDLR
jgi:hypothetical protein